MQIGNDDEKDWEKPWADMQLHKGLVISTSLSPAGFAQSRHMKHAVSYPSSVCIWLASLLVTVAAAFGDDTQRQYLSGHGKDDPAPWKFLCPDGPHSGVWTNLPVPSNWELFGFGTLHYQTEPANMFEEVGKYERDF